MSARPRLAFPRLPDLAFELQKLESLVPEGTVTTFGDLARALGSRHAAIWVSEWIREQADSRPELAARVVNLNAVLSATRFADFPDPKPLAPLEAWLQEAAALVGERSLGAFPGTIAGVDVAYPAPDRAVAAAVLIDVPSRTVLAEVAVEQPVAFPYISGFLTFREIPAMAAACAALPQAPDVVMIDGQGRLHPHRGGAATGFAAATGLPTIGIAKSLLCGKVDETELPEHGPLVRRMLLDAEHLGYAVRSSARHAPVYISVGGWLSLSNALAITKSMMGTTRLPLPTHLADRKTKVEARCIRGERNHGSHG